MATVLLSKLDGKIPAEPLQVAGFSGQFQVSVDYESIVDLETRSLITSVTVYCTHLVFCHAL